MTPGPTAYLAAKVKGDRSMPSKRERSEDADDPVPQGPRDTVRTELFEPQPPTMQVYIPRHSVLRRGHRDRATIVVVARTFHAVGDGTSSHSRGRTRHLRRARHVQHHGNVGSPDAPRGAGRRSRRSTPRAGKPSTRGRAVGVLRPGRGGTRDAKRRNRPGDHPLAEDTGEPGAPKGARPVRGGADGKVLTEQLASRLLHIVVGFEHEADARRFRDAMRARLEEFALTLHPDKTRLIAFGRFAADRRAQRGLGKPETFRFLGFTHICGRSRRGTFQLQRKSRADRMRATLRRVKDALRRRMHQPIPVQGRWLTQVVNGYFAYHAVPTNRRALMAFRHHVTDLWRRTLRRRSQKDRLTWARMAKLADAWLPRPHILHPWPSERFAVRHPRWEPSARIGPARICAGGAQ